MTPRGHAAAAIRSRNDSCTPSKSKVYDVVAFASISFALSCLRLSAVFVTCGSTGSDPIRPTRASTTVDVSVCAIDRTSIAHGKSCRSSVAVLSSHCTSANLLVHRLATYLSQIVINTTRASTQATCLHCSMCKGEIAWQAAKHLRFTQSPPVTRTPHSMCARLDGFCRNAHMRSCVIDLECVSICACRLRVNEKT